MIWVKVLHRNVRGVREMQREIMDLAVYSSDSLIRWLNNGDVNMRKLKDLIVYSFECLIF